MVGVLAVSLGRGGGECSEGELSDETAGRRDHDEEVERDREKPRCRMPQRPPKSCEKRPKRRRALRRGRALVEWQRRSATRRGTPLVVAQDVRRIVIGKINDTARQLLREMGSQAEGSPTPDVAPREAAENLGIDPGAPGYEAALNHLLALGDIEPNPDPALAEQGLYRLTRQGHARVRDLHRR
jgi:hypothetical protein